MIKLLATDLDGTLFYPKKKIRVLSEKNKAFLREVIKKNKEVVLVSGRNFYIADIIGKKLHHHVDMIACNGACVYVDNKLIDETPIEKKIVKDIFEKSRNDKRIVAWTFMSNNHKMVIVPTHLNFFIRFLLRIGLFLQFNMQEPYNMGEKYLKRLLEDDSAHIYKVMAIMGLGEKKEKLAQSMTDEYVNIVDGYLEATWSGEAIEFMKKGVSKANALKKLIDVLKLERNEVAVIGDSGNDVSMFKEFEHSFVMSHAPEEIKKFASTVVDNVYDLKNYIMKE